LNFLIRAKGFTLIEILISLIILSISLLALAGLMVTTTKNNSFGSHITEAATLAQDKLEEFRAMNWKDIQQGTDLVEGSTRIRYTRNWNVREASPNPLKNLKQIEITINWDDRIKHSIRLLSVLVNNAEEEI